MSGKLPALTGSEVIEALERGGFILFRIRGSHHFYGMRMVTRPWCRYTLVKSLGRGLWARSSVTADSIESSSEACFREIDHGGSV